MEDVLEVYHRRLEDNDIGVPDETSKQLVQETRDHSRRAPGLPGPTITNTSVTG